MSHGKERSSVRISSASSIHEMGAWGWELYLKRQLRHSDASTRKFAALLGMKLREDEMYVDVFVDGELFGTSALWIPRGSTLKVSAAATFPAGSYVIDHKPDGSSVVIVKTSNGTGNQLGRLERMKAAGEVMSSFVGANCEDRGGMRHRVCSRLSDIASQCCNGSDSAVSSPMNVRASTQNGVGIADMRGSEEAEGWSTGHWIDGGFRHHHHRHSHGNASPFCGRRCEDMRLVPIGCRKKCLKTLRRSRCGQTTLVSGHSLVPCGTRMAMLGGAAYHGHGSERVKFSDDMPILVNAPEGSEDEEENSSSSSSSSSSASSSESDSNEENSVAASKSGKSKKSKSKKKKSKSKDKKQKKGDKEKKKKKKEDKKKKKQKKKEESASASSSAGATATVIPTEGAAGEGGTDKWENFKSMLVRSPFADTKVGEDGDSSSSSSSSSDEDDSSEDEKPRKMVPVKHGDDNSVPNHVGCNFAEDLVGECYGPSGNLSGMALLMVPKDASADTPIETGSEMTLRKKIRQLIHANHAGFDKYMARNTLMFPQDRTLPSVLAKLKSSKSTEITASDVKYSLSMGDGNIININGVVSTKDGGSTNIRSTSKATQIYQHPKHSGLYVMVLDDLWRTY